MKKLFTLIAAALMAVSVNAAQLSVGEPTNNAGDGWYDTTTKTITFVSEDSYRPGWWLASWDSSTKSNVGTDYSKYDSFVMELEEAPGFEFQVFVEAQSEGSNGSKYVIATFGASDTKITVPLDETGKSMIMQVFLKIASGSGFSGKTAKFKSAYFENSEAEATSASIYTGSSSDNYIDWADNKVSATLDSDAKAMLVAGNVLRIGFEEDTTAEYWQVQVMGSWWTILESTKTMTADYISSISFGDDNSNAIINFTSGATYLDITLTDDDISTLNQQGAILLCGANIKVKSIDIYTPSSLPTAISTVKAAKVAEDGAYYNLSGQRVAKPSKGLYIQNGKKVIVK